VMPEPNEPIWAQLMFLRAVPLELLLQATDEDFERARRAEREFLSHIPRRDRRYLSDHVRLGGLTPWPLGPPQVLWPWSRARQTARRRRLVRHAFYRWLMGRLAPRKPYLSPHLNVQWPESPLPHCSPGRCQATTNRAVCRGECRRWRQARDAAARRAQDAFIPDSKECS
jgi:hypothetical protein